MRSTAMLLKDSVFPVITSARALSMPAEMKAPMIGVKPQIIEFAVITKSIHGFASHTSLNI